MVFNRVQQFLYPTQLKETKNYLGCVCGMITTAAIYRSIYALAVIAIKTVSEAMARAGYTRLASKLVLPTMFSNPWVILSVAIGVSTLRLLLNKKSSEGKDEKEIKIDDEVCNEFVTEIQSFLPWNEKVVPSQYNEQQAILLFMCIKDKLKMIDSMNLRKNADGTFTIAWEVKKPIDKNSELENKNVNDKRIKNEDEIKNKSEGEILQEFVKAINDSLEGGEKAVPEEWTNDQAKELYSKLSDETGVIMNLKEDDDGKIISIVWGKSISDDDDNIDSEEIDDEEIDNEELKKWLEEKDDEDDEDLKNDIKINIKEDEEIQKWLEEKNDENLKNDIEVNNQSKNELKNDDIKLEVKKSKYDDEDIKTLIGILVKEIENENKKSIFDDEEDDDDSDIKTLLKPKNNENKQLINPENADVKQLNKPVNNEINEKVDPNKEIKEKLKLDENQLSELKQFMCTLKSNVKKEIECFMSPQKASYDADFMDQFLTQLEALQTKFILQYFAEVNIIACALNLNETEQNFFQLINEQMQNKEKIEISPFYCESLRQLTTASTMKVLWHLKKSHKEWNLTYEMPNQGSNNMKDPFPGTITISKY